MAKRTRLVGVECASALEYRELRQFAARNEERCGARLASDGYFEVTDEARWKYILGLHSGRELANLQIALAPGNDSRHHHITQQGDVMSNRDSVRGRSVSNALTEAIEWAETAEDGGYLAEYEDHPGDDDGSRCGFDDEELAAIERVLSARGFKLQADDVGLVAREVVD